MRLAPRLVLAFGFIATLSVVGLGYLVREDRRASETERFEQEVKSACERVVAEVERQGESDRKLVAGACKSGELVDRALIWLEAGTLDDQHRLALSRLVPEEREAFDLDELLLATTDGDRLGQDPIAPLHGSRADVAALLAGDVAHIALRPGAAPALVARCRKSVASARGASAGLGRSPPGADLAVGLTGGRLLLPVLDRLGKTINARVSVDGTDDEAGIGSPGAGPDVARATCALTDAAGTRVPIVVTQAKTTLAYNLARIDQAIVYAGLASTGIALLLAVLLARSLGRPIAELASEARKVASGDARPLRVRGPREIAELAHAFDTMLVDLEVTRQRLAATSRVAAWREVARRVAHEIKNPLAPIRAAVETLRRLRARQDPEFDAYFDQATRTVLDEVLRISTIVTEFTRFARLPQPRPETVDLAEVARQVVQLHQDTTERGQDATERGQDTIERAATARARLELVVESAAVVLADRDQIARVLTNLVQNAIDAVAGVADPASAYVRVTVAGGADEAVVTVADTGSGISPEMAARLFDPYATSKPHGTGLGLAIAQRIAIEHDGQLTFEPREGRERAPRETVFRLRLPVKGPRPPAA